MNAAIYLPDNPQLDRALSGLPGRLRRYVDHARVLLHFTAVKGWLHHLDERGYALLHYAILRHYVPGRVLAPLKRSLTNAGVIDTAPHSAGHYSAGYRIGPDFSGPPRRIVLADARLSRKILAFRRQYTNPHKSAPPDVLARRGLILAQMDQALGRLGFVAPADQVIAHAVSLGADRDHAAYISQVVGHRDSGSPRVCAFGYRVHSIVTRTAREVRRQFTLDGAPLVELDVANSQPLLLAVALADPATWAEHLGAHNISNSAQHNGEGRACPRARPAPCFNVDPGERRAFASLCEAGKLYDFLAEAGRFQDRDKAKQRLFTLLYDRPRERPSTMARILSREWPTCMAAVEAVKQAFGYKAVSQVLQRLESAIVIDDVCGRLVREHPDVGFLTVHDSLLVQADWADVCRAIMAEEFAKAGVRAKIREKTGKTLDIMSCSA